MPRTNCYLLSNIARQDAPKNKITQNRVDEHTYYITFPFTTIQKSNKTINQTVLANNLPLQMYSATTGLNINDKITSSKKLSNIQKNASSMFISQGFLQKTHKKLDNNLHQSYEHMNKSMKLNKSIHQPFMLSQSWGCSIFKHGKYINKSRQHQTVINKCSNSCNLFQETRNIIHQSLQQRYQGINDTEQSLESQDYRNLNDQSLECNDLQCEQLLTSKNKTQAYNSQYPEHLLIKADPNDPIYIMFNALMNIQHNSKSVTSKAPQVALLAQQISEHNEKVMHNVDYHISDVIDTKASLQSISCQFTSNLSSEISLVSYNRNIDLAIYQQTVSVSQSYNFSTISNSGSFSDIINNIQLANQEDIKLRQEMCLNSEEKDIYTEQGNNSNNFNQNSVSLEQNQISTQGTFCNQLNQNIDYSTYFAIKSKQLSQSWCTQDSLFSINHFPSRFISGINILQIKQIQLSQSAYHVKNNFIILGHISGQRRVQLYQICDFIQLCNCTQVIHIRQIQFLYQLHAIKLKKYCLQIIQKIINQQEDYRYQFASLYHIYVVLQSLWYLETQSSLQKFYLQNKTFFSLNEYIYNNYIAYFQHIVKYERENEYLQLGNQIIKHQRSTNMLAICLNKIELRKGIIQFKISNNDALIQKQLFIKNFKSLKTLVQQTHFLLTNICLLNNNKHIFMTQQNNNILVYQNNLIWLERSVFPCKNNHIINYNKIQQYFNFQSQKFLVETTLYLNVQIHPQLFDLTKGDIINSHSVMQKYQNNIYIRLYEYYMELNNLEDQKIENEMNTIIEASKLGISKCKQIINEINILEEDQIDDFQLIHTDLPNIMAVDDIMDNSIVLFNEDFLLQQQQNDVTISFTQVKTKQLMDNFMQSSDELHSDHPSTQVRNKYRKNTIKSKVISKKINQYLNINKQSQQQQKYQAEFILDNVSRQSSDNVVINMYQQPNKSHNQIQLFNKPTKLKFNHLEDRFVSTANNVIPTATDLQYQLNNNIKAAKTNKIKEKKQNYLAKHLKKQKKKVFITIYDSNPHDTFGYDSYH